MMTLGERILQLRTAAGISQEELGHQLNITRQTVSRWELDQALPTIDRIVRLSRLFGVTTDSLLVDGISTFAGSAEEPFCCGVYRGKSCEAVETERFAYLVSLRDDGALEARLYTGSPRQKHLIAHCLRTSCGTFYAFRSGANGVVSNDPQLADGLDQPLDRRLLTGLRRRETFYVDHSSEALPTVAQLGIRRCLAAWRMSAAQTADAGHLHFFLCTGRTEYVMSIRPENTDVYCGASVNIPFDMGLISGGQYFRLRSCGDNSAPWCRCFSDFAFEPRSFSIPVEEYRPGQCVQSSQGLMWCVKRYSDNEIVLQGCESDEYIYRRDEMRHERYTDQHPE